MTTTAHHSCLMYRMSLIQSVPIQRVPLYANPHEIGKADSAPNARTNSTATTNPYLVADSLDSARALDNCMVSSRTILNFRRQPAGDILSLYMGGSPAIARTDNWFKVRYLGNEGWISAHYVTTSGDCD